MFSPESLDTRARKIITVQKLEEEYETSAKDAMDLYTALGKRIAGTDGVVVLPRGDE